MKDEEISAFGKGFLYCMGLFCGHAAMEYNYPLLWFSGASDHLREMVIPDVPAPLRARIEAFKQKCLLLGDSTGTEEATRHDVLWAVKESVEILREIDEMNGIKTIRADVL